MTTPSLRARALPVASGLLVGLTTPAWALNDPNPEPAGLPVPAALGAAPLGLPLPDGLTKRPVRKPRPAVSRKAKLTKSGRAIAPAGAPRAVREIIAAGNRIASKPYVYGGGHGSWKSAGYDCSGSVSYALHGADLLDTQLASGALAGFGKAGKGRWVTIYAHGGHTYMTVAGLRFDTTAFKQSGSRWSRDARAESGYTVRHPARL